jgi:methylmalonyl-CoA mutase N-terminal domain/subunit
VGHSLHPVENNHDMWSIFDGMAKSKFSFFMHMTGRATRLATSLLFYPLHRGVEHKARGIALYTLVEKNWYVQLNAGTSLCDRQYQQEAQGSWCPCYLSSYRGVSTVT